MSAHRNFSPIRSAVRSLVRIYYPKIEISHRERIPDSGPVLLVANHANSLIDPVILGIAAGRPVRFLAKAPLFDIPIFGSALRALGMVPAYRGSDDPGQVKSNLKSLTAAAGFLQRGDTVGIFPEGKSHDAARIDRVKSGAARIAMAASNEGATSLKIVPVGINYQRKERFRSSIWVRIGEPISVQDWLTTQGDDEKQNLRALTTEIDRRLKEVVVHLNESAWEPFLRDLEILVPPKERKRPVAAIRQRKRLADGINHFVQADPRRAARLAVGLRRFRDTLSATGIKITSPLLWSRGWRRPLAMGGQALWMLLVFIPAALGAAHNLVPFLLVRAITSLLRQPGKMTLSLARLGIGIPIFAGWYIFVWRLMADYFLPWVAWTWALVMPFAGVLAQNYFFRAKQNAHTWKDHLFLLLRPKKIAALRSQFDDLRIQLSEMDDAYNQIQPADTPAPLTRVTRQMIFRTTIRWTVIVAAAISFLVWNSNRTKNLGLPELKFAGPDWSIVSAWSISTQLASDEKALHDILIGLGELEARAATLRQEFASQKRSYYRQEDNDAIRGLLLTYLNYRAALLRLVWKYQTYEAIPAEPMRLRAFLIGLTAGSSLYDASLKFVVQHPDPVAIRKLNEAEPLWGIPPNLLDTIHRNLVHPENRRLLSQAQQRYQELQPAFRSSGVTDSNEYELFDSAIARSQESARQFQPLLGRETLKVTTANVASDTRNPVYKVKTMVSSWIGDTKIREPRSGKSLIQPEQVDELRSRLQPGDILLERRNWFLSNAFLPGYWPHAALYVGTPEDLQRMGLRDDPRVEKHWRQFVQRDKAGHELVIIESVSEGVVFSSLEHSIGGGDSAAALRPRLDPARVRESIARAFSHVGKPYDFDFDFFSTDKLVCTELVFRSYDGDIQFPLVEILGTRTMPAIELVRKFSSERGQTNAQLDFVSFLDGDEKKGRARFVDEDVFIGTLRRPALTWLQ